MPQVHGHVRRPCESAETGRHVAETAALWAGWPWPAGLLHLRRGGLARRPTTIAWVGGGLGRRAFAGWGGAMGNGQQAASNNCSPRQEGPTNRKPSSIVVEALFVTCAYGIVVLLMRVSIGVGLSCVCVPFCLFVLCWFCFVVWWCVCVWFALCVCC